MILTYLNIILIKLRGDVSQTMRLGAFCLFPMTKPMDGTLVEKQLQLKYFNVEFINPLCLKVPMNTIGDALDVNS